MIDTYNIEFVDNGIPAHPVKLWDGSGYPAKHVKVWDGTTNVPVNPVVLSTGNNIFDDSREKIESFKYGAQTRIGIKFKTISESVIWRNSEIPRESVNVNLNIFRIVDNTIQEGSLGVLYSTSNPSAYPLGGYITLEGGRDYAVVSSPADIRKVYEIIEGIQIMVENGNAPGEYEKYNMLSKIPIEMIIIDNPEAAAFLFEGEENETNTELY